MLDLIKFKVKFDKTMVKYNKAKSTWVELKYNGHITDITNAASEVSIYSTILNKLNNDYKSITGKDYTDPCFYMPIKTNNYPML